MVVAHGLVAPWHVGSSQTRARTRVPCIGRRILNRCSTREAQKGFFLNLFFNLLSVQLRWVFVSACRLSLVEASGGYSSLRCVGFSLQWLLLWSTGSRHAGFSSCGSQALENRLSSRGLRAWLLRGMWDLPGPGSEPMSPALAGGFVTTVPPGKPPPLPLWSSFSELSKMLSPGL